MYLKFSPDINLLIGDNRVGKTSVLDALSVALGGEYADLFTLLPASNTGTVEPAMVRDGKFLSLGVACVKAEG